MKFKHLRIFTVVLVGIVVILFVSRIEKPQISGAPPYGEPESAVPLDQSYSWQDKWIRPEVPATVGLQVGHWKNNELPEELSKLIGNTGAQGGGKTESEVNLVIVELIAEILRKEGVQVDIIPATVPKDYWADVFVAIHADGSADLSTNGFKIASPWRDLSGDSKSLVEDMVQRYQASTNLAIDPNISRNMRGYYAFSWWRYDHAIHPMTTALIVETGFLTSSHDRKIIVEKPLLSAIPIAEAILEYLRNEAIL
ncbi:MAG: N-acetylmuramoyl-L-alanine amidase [Microgenomates group bacterium]